MMKIYNQEISSVFQLLGEHENDITKAIGFVLDRSRDFAKNFLALIDESLVLNEYSVLNQKYENNLGYTDIEILDNENDWSIIIEAKRGYIVPGMDQLNKYAKRENVSRKKYIVTLSCLNKQIVDYKTAELEGSKINHISYADVVGIIGKSIQRENNKNKVWLNELDRYLRGLINMRDEFTNKVYCVVLSSGQANDDENNIITYRDEVEKYKKYYHPIGKNGWPQEPLTYLCVRYNGYVKGIYHVDSFDIVKSKADCIIGGQGDFDDPHYLYNLGENILTDYSKSTKGIFASGRLWACLDLILTEKTLNDAVKKSKERGL